MIVVADADRGAGRFLVRSLSSRGYDVAYTTRGEEVLRLTRHGDVDLAIVDVSLSDMPGHALAMRLREVRPKLRILMTAADCRPELEMRAHDVGVSWYAHKPVNVHQLEAIVAQAIGGPVGDDSWNARRRRH